MGRTSHRLEWAGTVRGETVNCGEGCHGLNLCPPVCQTPLANACYYLTGFAYRTLNRTKVILQRTGHQHGSPFISHMMGPDRQGLLSYTLIE